MSEGRGREEYDWNKDRFMILYSALLMLQIIASAYHYNSTGNRISIYLGWLTIFGSLLLASSGYQELKRAGGAPDEQSPLRTTVLVETGVYSVVRHPQYLGFLMVVPALMLLSQHLLSFVLGVSGGLLFYMDVRKADGMLVERFGEEYLRYTEEVPGLNLIAGIIRKLS
jgi:protein-S-isoprenylcysteine O-methyltransferase Ste14